MFKRLMMTSIVFTIASSSFANHPYPYNAQMYQRYHDYKSENEPPPPPCDGFGTGIYFGALLGPRVTFTGAPATYNSFEGIITAGYSAMWTEYFFLAGEGFLSYGLSLRNYVDYDRNSARTTWTAGLGLLPGVLITDYVLTYFRLGVVKARFDNQGLSLTGWQIGIGGETNLCGGWDIRGEYIYSQFNRQNQFGTPRSNQFNFGIIYKIV